MRGKLDQKSSHFEVDWAMGRDIRKVNILFLQQIKCYIKKRNEMQIIFIQYFPLFQSDVAKIEETLKNWCESCDGMLACLEEQVNRANETKQSNIAHQKQIEQKVR